MKWHLVVLTTKLRGVSPENDDRKGVVVGANHTLHEGVSIAKLQTLKFNMTTLQTLKMGLTVAPLSAILGTVWTRLRNPFLGEIPRLPRWVRSGWGFFKVRWAAP